MKKIILLLIFVVLVVGIVFSKSTSEYIAPITQNIFIPSKVSVLNFGDVMFDRGVRNIIENRGRDPFEYIKKDLDKIKKYDVVIANLEGPIVVADRKDCQQKAYNFQFATDTTDRLKSVGINMVNIANNHTYDCYEKGFSSTKNYLQKASIDYIGDLPVEKSFVIKDIKGKKVAFVGIDRTVSSLDIEKYYDLIKTLKVENDIVIVDIHWGTEYSLKETSEQTVAAHRLVDSGAGVIFGHHPHVIEPVEVYKGGVIFYSLGNFVFDQTGENETLGIGVGAEFSEKNTSFEILPFRIKIFAPDFLVGESKQAFCEKFLLKFEHNGCEFYVSYEY